MGNLVIVGLGELQPLFGACELFVGSLWNVFSGSNDGRLLWNGTQGCDFMINLFNSVLLSR